MGNRLCHGAFFEAEAFYKTEAFRAGFMVAFNDCHLHDILLRVRFRKTVSDRQIGKALIRTDPVGDDFNHAGLYRRSGGFRRRNTEGLRRDRLTDMHGMADRLRHCSRLNVDRHFPVFRNNFTVDHGACDADVVQVFEEDYIGAFARRNASHFVVHAEAGGNVDRDILDGFDRVEPLADGAAQNMVKMAVVH